MLPLSLLRAAKNQPLMVELKNGETYSGVLGDCDNFMNLHLRDPVCTARNGDRFWKLPECYIRGNNIKYFRCPDEVKDLVKDLPQERADRRGAGKGKGKGKKGGKGKGKGGKGIQAGPGGKKRPAPDAGPPAKR
jgi:U6 snRNA-associated Sm-like protein LSm4